MISIIHKNKYYTKDNTIVNKIKINHFLLCYFNRCDSCSNEFKKKPDRNYIFLTNERDIELENKNLQDFIQIQYIHNEICHIIIDTYTLFFKNKILCDSWNIHILHSQTLAQIYKKLEKISSKYNMDLSDYAFNIYQQMTQIGNKEIDKIENKYILKKQYKTSSKIAKKSKEKKIIQLKAEKLKQKKFKIL